MKIFVTGGTGFVGSNFINCAMKAGHELIVQRRLGSTPRIKLLSEPKWINKNLDNEFYDELKKCDVMVHFAAHTPNPPYAKLEECIYWNVTSSANLIYQAAAAGVDKIIIAGTCFEYGTAAIGQEFVHPSTEMRPELSYPISKAAATSVLTSVARELNLKLKVLRIFQVFGEGEDLNRFWPSLCDSALNGSDFPMSAGTQIRDFIDVKKVAMHFVNSLDFNGVENGHPQISNVGTGQGQSLLDFASFWWDRLNAKGQLKPGLVDLRTGEIKRLVANINDLHVL